MIFVKPHHFMDIIKLYGKGIEKFVPNDEFHHDFYAVANRIISDHNSEITLTTGQDDICSPCKFIDENGICTDSLNHIPGICSKDAWNKILDHRIIDRLPVNRKNNFTAQEFCEILYSIREEIYNIWKEEPQSEKELRYTYFTAGAKKYLGL